MDKTTLDEEVAVRLKVLFRINKIHLAFVIFFNLIGIVILYLYYALVVNKQYAIENTFQTVAGLLAIEFFLGIGYVLYLAFYKIPDDINKEKDQKIQELEIAEGKQELNLFVTQGGHIYLPSEEAGELIPCLVLDVVNLGDRKIIELDAHLSAIDQWTEEHPDDRNISNAISTPTRKRLQWDNGRYQIELKPGFSELKKLKLAMLNCWSQEFAFIHEGRSIRNPFLQQDAIYRFTVVFKGKLEGDDLDYKYFVFETEFVCSPQNCILDYLPRAATDPKFPNSLKRKLRVLEEIEIKPLPITAKDGIRYASVLATNKSNSKIRKFYGEIVGFRWAGNDEERVNFVNENKEPVSVGSGSPDGKVDLDIDGGAARFNIVYW
jgi:hypothetical protein